ncbi:shikimate dehydrogenase [Oceanirhabdus seepicola]|uniref:Multifunctional fusion protein n=1 Tax=Oceanirhabdus seepicola TaxID=2828781 RepID=A0A9J6NWM1_9CLOT|nr:shikimate dehydrogenase [Oceanirhabdus seepicola]MCM1988398.1 shikimate dehydrogenase [Oceanirhabdus seepicola]
MKNKFNYGLIGKKLTHSFSPFIHNEFFKAQGIAGEYKLYEFDRDDIENKLQYFDDIGVIGINVTIPYKQDVMKFIDEISEEVKSIGAVNTIKFKDGKSTGYNTDYLGIKETFIINNVTVKEKKVIILGTGGASKAVIACLEDMGVRDIVLISRNPDSVISTYKVDSYENLHRYNSYEILINTTPVGMFPIIDVSPIEEKYIKGREFIFDLIYNPSRTRFLQYAMKNGVKCSNGLYMLVIQGLKSEEIWNEIIIPPDAVKEIFDICLKEKNSEKNIVLIGMPGSGKSTIGRIMSGKLGLKLIDCDEMIEKKAGKSISEIFKDGEDYFRNIEEEVLKEISMEKRCIISTGGGAIKREENIFSMKYNGTIYFIDRDVDKIYNDIQGNNHRPLVEKKEQLVKLYNERKDIYEEVCDFLIDNNGNIDDTINSIMREEGKV